MRRTTLAVDAAVAALFAVLVLILAPGLAVVAMLAIIVVVVCAGSFLRDARLGRPGLRRRPRPPQRRR